MHVYVHSVLCGIQLNHGVLWERLWSGGKSTVFFFEIQLQYLLTERLSEFHLTAQGCCEKQMKYGKLNLSKF